MAEQSLTLGARTSPVLQLQRLWSQPAIQRSLPALGLLGVAGAAALAWNVISPTPDRDLLGGLGESDRAAVASALDTAKLAYSIDAGTGAIRVATSEYYKARMLLAAQGLPKVPPAGAAVLDAMPMGSSHAVETERLREARESDLSRTIEAMDSIESARVHLAPGGDSPFLRDDRQPSASVMLTMRAGGRLSQEQTEAIVRLVASSVSGLNDENVSLTDQAGRMLSGGRRGGVTSEATRQIDVQERVEGRYRTALVQMLTPLVGGDAFTAEVHADLDFAENQSTRESFPQDQRAIRQEVSRWSSAPGEAPAVGIPGALSNTAPPATSLSTTPPPSTQPSATQSGATPPERTSQDMTRSYELGREVAVTKAPVGTIKRLSVAVALRNTAGTKPRSASEVAAIDALVKRAVGFDAARGDNVVVTARAFATVESVKTSWQDRFDFAAIGRYAAALATVALLVFGVGRPFLRARVKVMAERKAGLVPLLEGEIARQQRDQPITLDMISAAPSYADRASLVREFVTQDPKRAAAIVRTLLEPEAPARG